MYANHCPSLNEAKAGTEAGQPSIIKEASPTDVPTGQSDGGIFSV